MEKIIGNRMESNKFNANTIDFLGIRINNITVSELIHHVDECVDKKIPCHIVGLNVDQAVRAIENEYIHHIFDSAEIVFTDGTPIMWLAKGLGCQIKERIPGPDLMNLLCERAAMKRYRVFLLGAGPGVAEQASRNLESMYPGFICSGTYSPRPGFEKDLNEMDRIIGMLADSKSDLLFVGLGSPKQDYFIYENMNRYHIPVSFSIGAALDFIGESVKRAPKWMRKIGLEWFYRLIKEPKRLYKRYLINDFRIFQYYFFFKKGIRSSEGKD